MRPRAIAILLAVGLTLTIAPGIAVAVTLPDDRAYELLSNIGEDENVLNGATPWFGAATDSGDTVDWQALGGCCGASSAGLNSFQSQRTPNGWETRAFTPVANEPLTGLEALQEALLWSTDLRRTVFMTSASLTAGDQRPKGSDGDDLYLQGPTGALEWLTQGQVGSGRGPYPTNFEGATPDAGAVVFGSAEQLTANATGLSSRKGAEYLYVRNADDETTSLIDVNNNELIGTDGASIGDAGPPVERPFAFYMPGQYRGSTTRAISENGSKVFFETPPPGLEGPPENLEPHLYMRDLANETTTPLDNPEAAGAAHYQGASADGSLVFFTSDEGLAGSPKINELYEFNTTTTPIGLAPPMTAVPVASGAGIIGVTSISSDGSHAFFVASGVLATNSNAADQTATANEPNLYVYDADTGQTRFVTTLALPDVSNCKPTCASTQPNELVATADVFRPAYTTPDGSVLVFASNNDLTGQDHTPTTALSSGVTGGEHMITVTSTAGFLQDRTIAIGVGDQEQLATIEKVGGPTQLTLREFEPGIVSPHPAGTPVTELNSEIYRFSLSAGSLVCLSCTPDAVVETASASLGEVPGGSYAAGSGHIAQMSEDGSTIFFDSPDPLLPGMAEAETDRIFEPNNLYEWENGNLSAIATASNNGAVFDGTTPSAKDVFFSTRSALTPTASTGYEHIYDARANGGFPERPPPTLPCAEEACRPLPAPAPNVSPPASAAFGKLDEALAPIPAFSVTRITAAQRLQLARSGRIALTINATAPGEVIASAYSRIRRKVVDVARASGVLHQAGRVTLTLHLGRSARTQIARGQIHVLQVHVDYTTTGVVEVLQLAVSPPHKRSRYRRHGHE